MKHSPEAWVQVYRDTIGPLYASVSRRTAGDRELTEDVTQEVWMRALSDWRKRGVPQEPLAWLSKVARNLLCNHYRKQRPRSLAASELELAEQELEPRSANAAALLHFGFSKLKEQQTRLLEAYHFEGQGIQALAAELGLSERAVEGRLRRSRSALRECLTPYLNQGVD